MALNIGNKKYRTMQEQVGWNSERIDKILEFLDGVNLSDNVVIINDMSQILTPEELEVVNKTVSFLVYDGSLYIKKSQSASEAKFDMVFTISGSSVISFNTKEITVTLSNGALGITTATYTVYSVSQVDALLTEKASLSGATFTGNVQAKQLKQTEANNSIPITMTSSLPIENIYNRLEEINNILYLIVNFKITNNTESSQTLYSVATTGSIGIPPAIASKLIDLTGTSASEPGSDTLIATHRAEVINSISGGVTPLEVRCFLNLLNGNNPNQIVVLCSGNVSIPAGESRYVCARLPLTLI